VNRAALLARHLEKEFRVPVKIASLEFGSKKAIVSQLWIGNPRHSKTRSAFSAETIEVDASLKEVRGNPLTVERILIENILVGIEIYKGQDNNWSHILNHEQQKKKPSRDYVIRKLIIENLTVQVTQPNGSVKTYPTIPRMEFDNITSESGFPIHDIEKAIFNLMMKEILQKFGLQQLNQTFDAVVPGGSPLKYLFK
jgi:hypothetical protein